MYLSPTLVLATLPFLVTGAPFEGGSRNGLSIPITKHLGFRDANGVVDIAKLRAGQRLTSAKIQRGFEAFKRNTGAAHPDEPKLKRTIERRDPITLNEISTNLWCGSITVGTPPVTYVVPFDTASSDLLLPSSTCDSTCSGHTLYNASASSTSIDLRMTFQFNDISNDNIRGEQYTDDVKIGGYTATKQRLGAAATYSSGFQFDHFPADGVLGLAYQSVSIYGGIPVFQTLVSQGQFTPPVFSFYLAGSGSEIFIGGANQTLYKGSFTYMPVTKQGFWQGKFDGISVNGTTVIGSQDTVIDTGTTQVIGDTKSIQAIYDQISGSQFVGSGNWHIPCDFNTSVSITFSGVQFQISASTFNLGSIDLRSNTCVGGFSAMDGLGFFIVGTVFLQNVYTTFNLGNNSVGFATLASA